MKITLCGSIRHIAQLESIGASLQRAGHVVVIPEKSEWEKQNVALPVAEKKNIMRAYFPALESADALLVVNEEKNGIQGYVGANTFLEMAVGFYLNKPIYLLNPVDESRQHGAEEIAAMQPIILNGNLQNIKT